MDNDKDKIEALRDLILSGESGYLAEAERIGSEAIPMLLELLENPDGEIRFSALACISLTEDERVPKINIDSLGDADSRVRIRALQSLFVLTLDLSLLDKLAEHMKNPDSEVRADVALLLGRFDNPGAVVPLSNQLSEETDSVVIANIKLALARLGNKDCKNGILERLKTSESYERLKILGNLEYINDRKIARNLLPLLDDQADGYEIGDPDLPEYARICDAVVNLVSDWYEKPFSFDVDELKIYNDEEIEEVRKFVESPGE